MLSLYHRHLPTCPHRDKDRAHRKCDCPLHVDGEVRGVRVRQSLNTPNWDRAKRRMAELEDELEGGKFSSTPAPRSSPLRTPEAPQCPNTAASWSGWRLRENHQHRPNQPIHL